ncbi:MAG: hypothetical protein MUF27_09050 [Acidobacteria bacterium]|jgi:hypothetical protein|nr:hypothetical protein [Acidobacteriota bacterium]
MQRANSIVLAAWLAVGASAAAAPPPEGFPVTLPLDGYDASYGPLGLAEARDGWMAVSLGYGCGADEDSEFASYRWSISAEGEPFAPVCSVDAARYQYYYTEFWGGSMTRTPHGYAWTWLGLGPYYYVQAFDANGQLSAPLSTFETGYLPVYGRVSATSSTIAATSRSLVHVGCHAVAVHRWVAKRRLDFDGSHRSLESPLNVGTSGDALWLPNSYNASEAWNGERIAAIWTEADDPASNGGRIMIRFLDADSRTLGPAQVVATYPRRHDLWALSIAPTAAGWVVASAQRPPGDDQDLWLLYLDPAGSLVRSERITPADGVNAGGLGDSGPRLQVSPSGNIGVLFSTWKAVGGTDALWFLELDAAGRTLRPATRLQAEPFEVGHNWDIAWSGGRWGILWNERRRSQTQFAWYAERVSGE